MAKQLSFNEDARRKLKVGVDTLADAVKPPSAPKGATSPWAKNGARRPSPTTV